MVKSRFNGTANGAIIAFFIITIMLLSLISALISVTFFHSHIIPRGNLSSGETIVLILALLAIPAIFLYILMRFLFIVTIDTTGLKLSFKSLFTCTIHTYNFGDFDGYIDTFSTTRNGDYKTFYFIQNKKAIRIINGFYYSNMDELKNALAGIKYLGFREDYKKCARRALLNKPLID